MSFLRTFIQDEEFQVNYSNKKLNIKNYTKINYLEESRISLNFQGGTIIVYGTNLRIKKLLEQEILVDGNIENIELKRVKNG